jgi:DNA-binding response OmpR family regulator
MVGKYNILVVDDDPDITEVISLYLNNAGYNVHSARGSNEALTIIQEINFHLIIMDVMLPDFAGTTLCQKIRESVYCPILFISCNDDEHTILKALNAGGDDYIKKPINYKELIARVRSHLRRAWHYNSLDVLNSTQLVIKELTIDIEKHMLFIKNKEIVLSPIEFDILVFMARNANRVLHYSEIYESVWKTESIGDTRTVMVHVSNLRKKIQNGGKIQYIITVKKIGYKFIR